MKTSWRFFFFVSKAFPDRDIDIDAAINDEIGDPSAKRHRIGGQTDDFVAALLDRPHEEALRARPEKIEPKIETKFS